MSPGKPLTQTVECILGKKLLVLGAGVDQIPGLIKAKEMGIYTIALDGNAEAAGKTYADEFFQVSIKHFEQIESFINKQLDKTVDGVIAFGVDIPYIIARTATRLGVNYTVDNNAAQLSEDKYQSKSFMAKQGVNIPAYQLICDQQQAMDFINNQGLPVIIKPLDNSAARGVSFVQATEHLEQAIKEAYKHTQNDNILIEQYLNGPQVSTESLIIDGKIHNIGFADRNYTNMQRFFPHIIEDGGDLPSIHMTEHLKDALTQQIQLIIDGLKIKNAVLKGDIVIYQGQLYIIEFALRLSGGNFSTIEIPANTGIDFLGAAIKLHLNEAIHQESLIQTKNDSVCLRYKFAEDSKAGTIKALTLPKQHENILLQKLHISVGQTIENKTTDHAKRLGFVIAKGKDRQQALILAEQQLDKIEVILD